MLGDFAAGVFIAEWLHRIEGKIDALTKKVDAMANALDQKIGDVQIAVAAESTVIDSAMALISGFSAQLAAAVQAALDAGATAAQLQTLTDLKAAIDAKSNSLAAAVQQNTPPSH